MNQSSAQKVYNYGVESTTEIQGALELFNTRAKEYIDLLGRFEEKCLQPDADSKKLLEEFTVLNDAMLDACAVFEYQVADMEIIKQVRASFIEKTNPFFSKSYLFNRVRTWPQGHQGDFMTLELNYRKATLSEGIGYYFDKYFLAAPLAVAVRERLYKMRDLLKNELDSRISPKVLDVACGSCREVFELSPEIKASGAKIMCLDLDTDALKFALERFSNAGVLSNQVDFLSYNALRMFDYETAERDFGKQDVIFSLGFFDYLPDDFLVKLLKSLYLLLAPGGKLIAPFKEGTRYRSHEFHWFAHWDGFLQRSKPDFDRILKQAEIPESALSMTQIDSGAIIFYSAEKK